MNKTPPAAPGVVTFLTGTALILLGLGILLGAASTFRPPRPSYTITWGLIGGAVVAFGFWLVLSLRRR